MHQKLEGEYLLCQKLLCTEPYCVISNNNYTLTIKLLSIIFNLPNTTYSVEINDEFLKYKNDNMPVPDIILGKCMINTSIGMKG